jgi:hypothetical protein
MESDFTRLSRGTERIKSGIRHTDACVEACCVGHKREQEVGRRRFGGRRTCREGDVDRRGDRVIGNRDAGADEIQCVAGSDGSPAIGLRKYKLSEWRKELATLLYNREAAGLASPGDDAKRARP